MTDTPHYHDKAGPSRIIVIPHPTPEQIRLIPPSSDMIITDDSNFMAGVASPEIIEGFATHLVESGWSGYVAYLPPSPAADDLPTAQEVADDLMKRYRPTLEQFRDDEEKLQITLRSLVTSAVNIARNGMLPAPW